MKKKYTPIEPTNDMLKEPMPPSGSYQQNVSPVDALWALYQSQTKKVRQAFRQRLLTEDPLAKKKIGNIEEQLSNEECLTARKIAETVKLAAGEVKQATLKNTHIGRDADSFLAELEQETM